ncbi:hypothetical protein YC2023_061686 [Brassica napus]
MEREEEESMLLVAENGEGEGKKEAEERKVEETKRIIGKRRYIVWVDVSRRLRHEFYVFERHEISKKEASDGSRHDFMKRYFVTHEIAARFTSELCGWIKDDFVAEGLKTVKNRAQVVKALVRRGIICLRN